MNADEFNILRNFLKSHPTNPGASRKYVGWCNLLTQDAINWLRNNPRCKKKYSQFKFQIITFYPQCTPGDWNECLWPNDKYAPSNRNTKGWLFHSAILVNEETVHCLWYPDPEPIEYYIEGMFPNQYVDWAVDSGWRNIPWDHIRNGELYQVV